MLRRRWKTPPTAASLKITSVSRNTETMTRVSQKKSISYRETVTRVLSSHYPTSMPPESLNKWIVSDDSLAKDRGVCEEEKSKTQKIQEVCTSGKIENRENTESVYEWNRLPVERVQHMQPTNTKMRTERKNKRGN
jgi:hypothetical protein